MLSKYLLNFVPCPFGMILIRSNLGYSQLLVFCCSKSLIYFLSMFCYLFKPVKQVTLLLHSASLAFNIASYLNSSSLFSSLCISEMIFLIVTISFFVVSIFSNILVSHKHCPWYLQHSSVEPDLLLQVSSLRFSSIQCHIGKQILYRSSALFSLLLMTYWFQMQLAFKYNHHYYFISSASRIFCAIILVNKIGSNVFITEHSINVIMYLS